MKAANEIKINRLCDEVKITKELFNKTEAEVKKELANIEKKVGNSCEEKIKFIKNICNRQEKGIGQLKEENQKIKILFERQLGFNDRNAVQQQTSNGTENKMDTPDKVIEKEVLKSNVNKSKIKNKKVKNNERCHRRKINCCVS